MKMDGKWSDLETRGVVVLRDCVPPDLVQMAADDCRTQNENRPANAGIAPSMETVGMDVKGAFNERLQHVLDAIRANTDLQITEFNNTPFYFTSATMQWHTDPPPFYLFQNLYQFVNLWIPIVKPRPDLTGLCVVPMDTLRAKDPIIADQVLNGGAVLFCPQRIAAMGEEAVTDYLDARRKLNEVEAAERFTAPQAIVTEQDGHLMTRNMDFNLNDIAYTPNVSPGDIIVARGDVLHRGQDHETKRVALSLRAVNGNLVVRKDKVLGLSAYARSRLSAPFNPVMAPMLATFERHNRETITAHEFVEFMGALDVKDPEATKLVASVQPRVAGMLGYPNGRPPVTNASATPSP